MFDYDTKLEKFIKCENKNQLSKSPLCSKVFFAFSKEQMKVKNMAQYVKAKKVNQSSNKGKNPFWGKLWNAIKLFFLSMFSNQTCVDQAKSHWYVAVPLGIISCVLAVIPIGVLQWNQSGGNILASPSYSLENGLIAFQESLEDNNVSITINPKDDAGNYTHTIKISDNWKNAYSANSNGLYFAKTYTKGVTKMDSTLVYSSSSSYYSETGPAITTEVTCCDLVVYNYTDIDSSLFNETVTNTLNNADILGNTTYAVNTLFLGKSEFIMVKKPSGAKSYAGKLYGYYDGPTFDIKDFTSKNSSGVEYDVKRSQLTSGNRSSYIASSVSSWKTFFSDSWNSTRISSGWQMTGIWFGIYVGITVAFGFIIWLMCRGKDNLYHDLNLWHCQKIAYWASTTPAILALILGFMLSTYAQMFYIFIFGFRAMFMAMRTLRPYK